jgi:pimeloyl-ACP methyl ester carboxylesterase
MAYWEWGDPANDRVLLCLHGLTRTGRDFDHVARRLAQSYRVVCPDVVGRGRSDWLFNPLFYTLPQYVADMVTLIARLQPRRLSWLGTSMGGLIGIALGGAAAYARAMRAAHTHQGALAAAEGIRLDHLVLNDVGPRLSLPGLIRIGRYAGQHAEFATFYQAVAHLRESAACFGPHTEAQWEELARHVYVQRDGKWVEHYDLALALPLVQPQPAEYAANEQLLWQSFDAIDCPILIVRGQLSDLLTPACAAEMLARNPRAGLHEVPGVGHVPTLMSAEQIEPVAHFLETH